jgi:hypothetical protein
MRAYRKDKKMEARNHKARAIDQLDNDSLVVAARHF